MACAGIIFAIAALMFICPSEAQNRPDLKSVSKGIEPFSYTLLLKCALEDTDSNIIVSPFSVWSMMSVLYEGSAGYTKAQLLAALGYYRSQPRYEPSYIFSTLLPKFLVKTETIELETTNALFCDSKAQLKKKYEDFIRDTYKTSVTKLDFTRPDSSRQINSYVSRQTRGKINEIVKSFDLRDAQMILTNAIFFRGQWTLPFNVSETLRAPFFNENNKVVGEVNMMFQRSALPYVNMLIFKAHVVELPYGKASCLTYVDSCPPTTGNNQENRLSMIVVLPHVGVTLKEVIYEFPKVPVEKIFESLKEAAEVYEDDEVDVFLPRFSVSSDIVMNRVLTEMGIWELFDPKLANLTEMSTSENLHLSKVIHKAQIEVTEEGTVASAVTAGELTNRNTPPKFLANKPFLYLIIEKSTNVILFGGTYVKPSLF